MIFLGSLYYKCSMITVAGSRSLGEGHRIGCRAGDPVVLHVVSGSVFFGGAGFRVFGMGLGVWGLAWGLWGQPYSVREVGSVVAWGMFLPFAFWCLAARDCGVRVEDP